jgi:hypothetical protein
MHWSDIEVPLERQDKLHALDNVLSAAAAIVLDHTRAAMPLTELAYAADDALRAFVIRLTRRRRDNVPRGPLA